MIIHRFLMFTVLFSAALQAQTVKPVINPKNVERIERTLSSDEMQGRKVFSAGIDKAADFIVSEFKAAGLQAPAGKEGFRQSFEMVSTKLISISGSVDGSPLNEKKIVVITSQPDVHITKQSGYDTASIKPGSNLFREANKYIHAGKNILVTVDTSFAANFNYLEQLKRMLTPSDKSVVFILGKESKEYDITVQHTIKTMKLGNIVGMLPGKSRKNEYVIFSSHYDHLGIGKAVQGDSIFNGANDDAAGTTAVITLAKYFKSLGNNERTLVFAAFTAEEIGGFGSQYFSTHFDPSTVKAMFNIEMIGTESKWGKNSAYITGYEKTNMGELLQKNLESSDFKFYPDPYTEQQLFYRSDNATLARLGVPAHTISTSKMDSEKYYHTVDDEIETLDLDNMTMIIQAIALSSRSIVSGKDTPTRVDTQMLR